MSDVLAAWMRPFASYFTAAVWRHVLVLVTGTLLALGILLPLGRLNRHRDFGQWRSSLIAATWPRP